MPKNRLIWLSVIVRVLVCVMVLAIAVGVFTALHRSRPQPARSEQMNAAPRVFVMEAKAVEVRRQFDGFGTAAAMDSADVPARVTATVLEIPPEIVAGRWVERGQLLVRLDDSDFLREDEITTQRIADIDSQLQRLDIEVRSWEKRIELAEEQVRLAQAEFDRVAGAQEREVAKQREVDQAKRALVAAIRDETVAKEEHDKLPGRRAGLQALRLGQEAQQRLARQNVQRCLIVSPLTGVIQHVDAEVGENFASGQRVARVVDLARMEVPIRVPASARATLRTGDQVLLRATGFGNRQWSAQVSRIAPEDDESTRTATVYAEVEQDPRRPGGIAPGQFLRAVVESSAIEQRWIAPRRALQGDRLLLVNDGKVVSRAVEVDYQIEAAFPDFAVPDEQWVVLADPLPAGALVVINPSRSAVDGLVVKPIRTGDASSPEQPRSGEAAP